METIATYADTTKANNILGWKTKGALTKRYLRRGNGRRKSGNF